MKKNDKTKEQLINELQELRKQVAKLKNAETELNKVAEKLHISEERYRSFVEHSGEGIYLLEFENPIPIDLPDDEQIKLMYKYGYMAVCNDKMAQMYGLSKGEELAGMRLIELHQTDDDPENIAFAKAWIASDYRIMNAISHEYDKDGNDKYITNNCIGIVKDGFLIRMWASQQDITEKRQLEIALEKSEARHREIAANIPGIVYQFRVSKDGAYSFPYVSRGINAIWELSPEDVVNDASKAIDTIVPDDIESVKDSIKKSAKTLENWIGEFRIKTKTGEEKWLRTSATPHPIDGEGVLWNGVMLDITARKQKEEALRKVKQLEELDKMKDEFFSSAAHDLKNPLTPIKGKSQLLLQEYFGEMNEKQRKSVETILKNTNRLIRLTDDITTISRMRAGVLKFEMTEHNICDIIEESVENMELSAKEKHIALIKKYPMAMPPVKCDKDRINQVIGNLIGNAVKFTPENGKITVRAEKIKNNVIISVEDTGIGISEENQKRVFGAFFQVGSKYGGTGLGLAICKNIVEAHHGNIRVESALGKGSKFIFTLPVK